MGGTVCAACRKPLAVFKPVSRCSSCGSRFCPACRAMLCPLCRGPIKEG